jgi:hypothetical protein
VLGGVRNGHAGRGQRLLPKAVTIGSRRPNFQLIESNYSRWQILTIEIFNYLQMGFIVFNY